VFQKASLFFQTRFFLKYENALFFLLNNTGLEKTYTMEGNDNNNDSPMMTTVETKTTKRKAGFDLGDPSMTVQRAQSMKEAIEVQQTIATDRRILEQLETEKAQIAEWIAHRQPKKPPVMTSHPLYEITPFVDGYLFDSATAPVTTEGLTSTTTVTPNKLYKALMGGRGGGVQAGKFVSRQVPVLGQSSYKFPLLKEPPTAKTTTTTTTRTSLIVAPLPHSGRLEQMVDKIIHTPATTNKEDKDGEERTPPAATRDDEQQDNKKKNKIKRPTAVISFSVPYAPITDWNPPPLPPRMADTTTTKKLPMHFPNSSFPYTLDHISGRIAIKSPPPPPGWGEDDDDYEYQIVVWNFSFLDLDIQWIDAFNEQ